MIAVWVLLRVDGAVDPNNTLVFTSLQAAMMVLPGVTEWDTGAEGHWCVRGTRWGDWDIHEALLDHVPDWLTQTGQTDRGSEAGNREGTNSSQSSRRGRST